MGFGWLLFGYFIATFMSINIAGSFIRLLGYGIIIYSVNRLRKYNRSFNYTLLGALLVTLVSVAIAVVDGNKLLYDRLLVDKLIFGEGLKTLLGYVEMGASFLFGVSLLFAIWTIAKETEVLKIVSGALRNLVFISVYLLMQIACAIPAEGVRNFVIQTGLSLWAFIIYFVCIVLNHLLIFQCYARICDENDIEMERKPSRFAFVNKFRAELDEKQERARESTEKYMKEKIQSRQRKKRRK